ncbi:Iron-sulfur assembly protein 2, partial [Leucoagaricus sp. SymC.cos]
SIAGRGNDPTATLRIAVESGGCHGYQYKMELAKEIRGDDYHFSHPVVKPSNIIVDAVSLSLLNGSTIDYATELIGSSFRVADNPQAKGSGCGCGVSWELKE